MKMLTKRQLEDAARCDSIDCKNCSCNNDMGCEIEELAKNALAYRKMLERLEFSNLTWEGSECYICGGKNAHADDCELGALLKESEV